jgi:hypothetical protein
MRGGERKTSLQTTHSIPTLRTLPTVSRCLNNHILKNNSTTLATTTSSLTSSEALHPWYITGFTDAEGCFHIGINKHNRFKLGYSVEAVFMIHLHQKDLALLTRIKSAFGVGSIYILGKGTIKYKVSSVKELGVILDHIDKYPLLTQKYGDYLLFKQVFNLAAPPTKQRTFNSSVPASLQGLEGLRKVVAIKASMNKGLSDKLNPAYSDVIPVERHLVKDKKNP